MEHRYSRRLKCCLNVVLCVGDQPVAKVKTKNISRSGILLEVDKPEIDLSHIFFIVLTDTLGNPQWITRAMVIHISVGEMGMLLEEELPQAFYRDELQYRH